MEKNGGGGIRTPGAVARTTVFKTVAISRSATAPNFEINLAYFKAKKTFMQTNLQTEASDGCNSKKILIL